MPFADPPIVLPPQTVLQRFAGILRGLGQAVLGRIGAPGMPHHMVQAIHHKVIAAGLVVWDLMEALAAGTLKTRRSPVFAPGATRKPPTPPVEGVFRLPRRFGWLVRLVPSSAVTFGNQLRTLLEHPEMMALLAASPKAVRCLKSLCWMLANRLPPPFAPPPRPRKPYVPPKVKVERPARERRPSSPRWPAWPAVPGAGKGWDSGTSEAMGHPPPRPPGKPRTLKNPRTVEQPLTYSEICVREREKSR